MLKKKRLYYLAKYGQLGNQLSVLAHLVAFAIEYDYKIIHFKQDYLYKVLKRSSEKEGRLRFSKLLSNAFFSFFLSKVIVFISFNRNKRFLNSLFISQWYDVDTDLKKTNPPGLIAVTNWMFRDYADVIKHQEEIRKQLSFDDSSFTNAKQILQHINESFPSHTLVGVHVRRGDYATWLNGKFVFDDETYYSKLKDIAEQLEKSVFIICSNEKVNFDNPDNLSIIYANGSPAEDIFLLSKCSYIIGPPSTFSSYAAFLGNQNLLLLEDKTEDVTLSRFKKFYLR